jgi:hypothetical protein
MIAAIMFSLAYVSLHVGHYIGDYWVQTDRMAADKGKPGGEGREACMKHCVTYALTQLVMISLATVVTGTRGVIPIWAMLAALTFSGVTHYFIDRREHGLMFRFARWLGKGEFLRFAQGERTLGTGAWALDQSAHKLLSVFVPALICALGVTLR